MSNKGKDIGALWVKRGSKGEYLSGYVEIGGQKYPVVCFPNGYKKEAKHPDYRILPSEKREQRAPAEEAQGYERHSYQNTDKALDDALRGEAPQQDDDNPYPTF